MNTLSDQALMLKVKSGDIERLGLLYERYKKRIFGFFYQMHGNASLSEDLVQNVFMRVLKYKHTYTDTHNFAAWIFQIARNVNFDHFKKNKKKFQEITSLENSQNLVAKEDIHQQIVQNENLSTLHIALRQLSIEKREFLILSKLKELKYKEIGEVMGCTEGSARTKVHRALQELSQIFLQLEQRL